MKVLVDTNIIIATALFPDGFVAKSYFRALQYPYQAFVTDYILSELHEKIHEKFPDREEALEEFLEIALKDISVIPTPTGAGKKTSLRDKKDEPILAAAIEAGIDIILTGDKDFLEACISYPKMVNSTMFLEMTKEFST